MPRRPVNLPDALEALSRRGRVLLGDGRTAHRVWLSPDNSRYLARHIAGARLVELPGVDHDPWVGDTEQVLAVVRGFTEELAAQPGLRATKQDWVTAK